MSLTHQKIGTDNITIIVAIILVIYISLYLLVCNNSTCNSVVVLLNVSFIYLCMLPRSNLTSEHYLSFDSPSGQLWPV